MEGICVNCELSWSGPVFSDSSRDVAMATNFVAKLPTPCTTAPSGLYARLCHAFSSFFLSSSSSLMISRRQTISGPLDRFSQSFHWMKAFWMKMIDLDLFFDISRDVATSTNFWAKFAKWFHSAPWNFKTGCTIVLQMHALIAPLIALHRVKNGENWFSSFWVKVG